MEVEDAIPFVAGIIGGIGLSLAVKGNLRKLAFWRYFQKSVVNNAETTKLAVIVRDDMSMSYGKQLSQISHAALQCYIKTYIYNPDAFSRWESNNRPIVVAKVTAGGGQHLQLMKAAARKLRVQAELVSDAGRSQVVSGTLTALAIGPADSKIINQICGKLPAF